MEGKFQEILSSVAEKPGRSRLEPYAELVDELHRRKLTCRDIAAVLAEKCQFQVSKSAVNNFVRARSRRKRNSARRIATAAIIAGPVAPKADSVESARRLTEDEVRQRIAALKARRPVTRPSLDDFQFDPTQPLRLITPGKPASDK
jgi:IS30 family transposase